MMFIFDNTPVNDEGLSYLGRLTSLKELSLQETQITDQGLKQVSRLKSLVWLNLRYTGVSDAAVAAIRKDLPKCEVRF